MNASNYTRIETLHKDNYDTWKLQMIAVLAKNDAWEYVSGECAKPALTAGDATSEEAVKKWTKNDFKARSDIVLSIKPSELKLIKGCETSRVVWLKLENTYQSKGPARKATLLKQLMLHRMQEDDDIREHVRKFHDTVDKLAEMNINMNWEMLVIMLLYSLPPSFANFRCAIESRDELPSLEALQTKILEESDARKNDARETVQNAMFARKKKGNTSKIKTNKSKVESKEEFKYRCHKCKEKGHKAADCKNKKPEELQQSAKKTEDTLLCTEEDYSDTQEAFHAKNSTSDTRWCLDSGATSHVSGSLHEFKNVDDFRRRKLHLANSSTSNIRAAGSISFATKVNGDERNITLNNVLHVPDLRENLLSVAKITDKDYQVIFERHHATVLDPEGNVRLLAYRTSNLYYISAHEQAACKRISEPSSNAMESLKTWHRRLGHLNTSDIIKGARDRAMQGLDVGNSSEKFECEICIRGKMTRAPFPAASVERTVNPLDIIHSDICGPMRSESKSGARYFITFIDGHSR